MKNNNLEYRIQNIENRIKTKDKRLKCFNSKFYQLSTCKIAGFTLVELIVTIVILAILWAIAFISFQWYSKNSRDSARIADINMLQKWLGIFVVEKWFYPDPDNSANITYSWWLAWIEWTIWDNVIKNIDNVSKKTTDPLTGNEYTYSITSKKTEYQIWAIKESQIAKVDNSINKTYAADLKQANALVVWNYNWYILKVNTWWTDYILAMPTIITSNILETDLISQIDNKLLVYDNYSNIPHSYNTMWTIMTWWFDYDVQNPVVYAWNLQELTSSWVLKEELINDLKTVYEATGLNSSTDYQELLTIDTEDTNQEILFADKILYNKTTVSLTNSSTSNLTEQYPFLSSLTWWTIYAIWRDSSGNIFAWWYFISTIVIWTWTVSTNWQADWFVVKYNASWSILWGKTFWWTDQEWMKSLALDSNWNVYVWWSILSSTITIWSTTLTNIWWRDWLVVKYDTNGNFMWAKNVWWTANDNIYALKWDNNGNMYLWWDFYLALQWTSLSSSWWTDWFLIKIDNNLTNLWAKKVWWSSVEVINSITQDIAWNLYAWWSFSSTSIGLSWATLTSSWNYDWFIVKYDTNWNPLWVKNIWGSNADYLNNLSIDTSSNLYAWWYFLSSSMILGSTTLTNSWNNDWFISKFDSNWTPLWAKKIWWVSNDYAYTSSIDSWNLYVWWYYASTTMNIWATTLTNSWNIDWFFAKYDLSWNPVYAKKLWSTNADYVYSLVWDNYWNIYVWCLAWGLINFSWSWNLIWWVVVKYDKNWDFYK